MKFLHYLKNGTATPALIAKNSQIVRSISNIVNEINPSTIQRLIEFTTYSDLEIEKLPILSETLEYDNIKNCITNPGKIIAVGLNYLDHLKALNFDKPQKPIFFLKATSSITGPYDSIYRPKDSLKLDYENELGIIIKKPAKNILEANAYDYIAGYCIVNDVSERNLQFQPQGQFTMGKSCDGFCPVGPYIVSKDEVDPNNLAIKTWINDNLVQDGSTNDMVFSIPYLISYLSNYFTLHPGDIIATGTPAGTQIENEKLGNITHYLEKNDVITLEIEGLGRQQNIIRN